MSNILTYSPQTVIQSTDTFVGGSYSGLFPGGYGFAEPLAYSITSPSQTTPNGAHYLSTPYTPDFDLSAVDFYIQADFYVNAFTTGLIGMTIVSKDRYGYDFDWNIAIVNNTTIAVYSNATTTSLITTVPTMNTGQWYNVKFERIGGTNTLYLDAVAYGTNTMPISNSSTNYVTIGCMSWNNPGDFFNGYIDNVIIYNDGIGSNVLDVNFENLDPGKLFFTDNAGKILTINPLPPNQKIMNDLDIVRDGLIVHYDMVKTQSYDRIGSTVNDLTTFSHTGTLGGGTSFTADGGISFDGIDGSLIYSFSAIPEAMTHIIFAKSNEATWSNYNGLGANRDLNGWSMHTWQSSTDISFGWNGNDGCPSFQ